MKETPIIFSAPSIPEILSGAKCQTRRLAKPEEFGASTFEQLGDDFPEVWARNARPRHPRFGEAGDRLWVKETWAVQHAFDAQRPSEISAAQLPPGDLPRLRYAASEDLGGLLARTPLYMPRWASRITLRLAEVRLQWLQDISEADARAEGVRPSDAAVVFQAGAAGESPRLATEMANTARGAFACLWDSIQGKRAPWRSNPLVWALTFAMVTP